MEQVQLARLDGSTAMVSATALDRFEGSLSGHLLSPGRDGYEQARRVWNGMIDRKPALIARCADTEDVVRAVKLAAEHDLLMAVRGGGHNVAGTASCDGGLVIDLSMMNAVEVDPERRVVRVGGGARWGEVDAATQALGLATPGGVVSDTGVAGLTLGGGLGWIRRKHGLSCDAMIGAEVVTADGVVIHTSGTERPELLWGLRGGGGNFGVVTAFEFQLYPVGPEVMVAWTMYPAERAGDLLAFYDSYATAAPDEVSSFAIFASVPPAPTIPAEVHGRPTLMLAACYAGAVEEGRAVMRPLCSQGPALADLSGPMPYVELQKFFDEDYPAGELQYYWKSLFLRELSPAAAARLGALAAECPSPLSTLDLWQLGGAMSRVRPGDTAFAERGAPYLLGIEANWPDAADNARNVAWARRVFEEMQAFSTGGSYLNFEELRDDAPQAALHSNYARLRELKRAYDPANRFRVNQNVLPSEG